MKKNSLYLLPALFALTACSFQHNKGNTATPAVDAAGIDHSFLDGNGNLVVPSGKVPGYNTVKALVFTPYCASCHMGGKNSGNVMLDAYAPTKEAIQRIYQAVVVDQSMPQGTTMPPSTIHFVKAWISNGGPENDLVTNGGPLPGFTPPPGMDPSFYDAAGKPVLPPGKYPGYKSLSTLVFENRCFGCHFTGNTNHVTTLFDNYKLATAVTTTPDGQTDSMMMDIGKAVLAGQYMPLKGPLPPNEQALVRAWIEANGPENDLPASAVTNPVAAPSPQPIPSPAPADASYFGPDGKTVVLPLPNGQTPDYKNMYALVFAPYCVSCHNINHDPHGVRVDTMEDAVKSSLKLLDEVNKGNMPPNRPECRNFPPIAKRC